MTVRTMLVEVDCPVCGNANRAARRGCGPCGRKGRVVKRVPTPEAQAEAIVGRAFRDAKAERP